MTIEIVFSITPKDNDEKEQLLKILESENPKIIEEIKDVFKKHSYELKKENEWEYDEIDSDYDYSSDTDSNYSYTSTDSLPTYLSDEDTDDFKNSTNLLDDFARAYLDKNLNKLNKICDMGRKVFPNTFNKDKDNIIGHYLSGNMSAVLELSKQIIENNNDNEEEAEKLLGELKKARDERDLDKFNSIIEIGEKKFPNVFNPNEDNIAGYFLINKKK